ncbi:MAG TPA: PH domain-containing protein, partial [Longimicrobium sp.]|nr:PH domain-containing protein [Longimicrobium sp.]
MSELEIPVLPPSPPPAAAPPVVRRMSPSVVDCWRASTMIWTVFFSLLLLVFFLLLEWSPLWALPAAVLGTADAVLVPPHRYRHFGYTVDDEDVRVMSGWLWRTTSVVPNARIQHVDTRQGPLQRMFGLATVVIFTAGSVGAMVSIPGLDTEVAEALRDRLAAI